jgi:hypothetical protein
MFPARSLVSDAGGFSIVVCGLMLSCWTSSGVTLAVALCVAIALGVPITLCIAVATSVLARRALWPGLALRSR